jgi:hypothetical protein
MNEGGGLLACLVLGGWADGVRGGSKVEDRSMVKKKNKKMNDVCMFCCAVVPIAVCRSNCFIYICCIIYKYYILL